MKSRYPTRKPLFCLHCGTTLSEGTVYCPRCGRWVQEAVQEKVQTPSPGWKWYLSLLLVALGFFVSLLAASAVGGYQGLQERQEINRQLAVIHYQRGLAQLNAGNFLLAIAELEEAARLSPDYREAQELLQVVQGLAQAQASPTSEALGEAADTLYLEAQTLHQQGDWEEAIATLERLQRLAPNYSPEEVGGLLFSAYYNAGLKAVEEGKVEAALVNFDRALNIRPSDEATLQQRRLASLYVSALSRWGIDWKGAAESLETLYQERQDYADVKERLFQAHVELGENYYKDEAWCLAEREYSRANEISPNTEIASRGAEARRQCLEALGITPTPE